MEKEEELPITTEEVLEKATFKSLGVCDELCEACDRLNFKIPTKIQCESLPYTLKGRDIIGLAETGSGKPWPSPCLFFNLYYKVPNIIMLWLFHPQGEYF